MAEAYVSLVCACETRRLISQYETYDKATHSHLIIYEHTSDYQGLLLYIKNACECYELDLLLKISIKYDYLVAHVDIL